MTAIKYRSVDVDGLKVFYREAGAADAPALLLLHGFPSAGHMFRDLIPLLADRFHIVAPDLPGFGQSDMPGRNEFTYTFDHVAEVIDRFTEVICLKVFYREAGAADAPALLLLHGFPSAGHMFRDLIPLLADRFHIVAPDLPGFGQSDMPGRNEFTYTFDHVAEVIDRFTEVIGL